MFRKRQNKEDVKKIEEMHVGRLKKIVRLSESEDEKSEKMIELIAKHISDCESDTQFESNGEESISEESNDGSKEKESITSENENNSNSFNTNSTGRKLTKSETSNFESNAETSSNFESRRTDTELSLLEKEKINEINPPKPSLSDYMAPESPLPELLIVVEDQKDKHDHPIEYYRRVLKKALKFYRLYVIEGKDISDVSTDSSAATENASQEKMSDIYKSLHSQHAAIEISSTALPTIDTNRSFRNLNKSAPPSQIPTEAFLRPLSNPEAPKSLPLRPLTVNRNSSNHFLHRDSNRVSSNLDSSNRDSILLHRVLISDKENSANPNMDTEILKPIAKNVNDPRNISNANKDASRTSVSESQYGDVEMFEAHFDYSTLDPEQTTNHYDRSSSQAQRISSKSTNDKDYSKSLSKRKGSSSISAENTKEESSITKNTSETSPSSKRASLSKPCKDTYKSNLDFKAPNPIDTKISSNHSANPENYENCERNINTEARRERAQIESNDNTSESSETCYRVICFKADVHDTPAVSDSSPSEDVNNDGIETKSSIEAVEIMRRTVAQYPIGSLENEPNEVRKTSDISYKRRHSRMEQAITGNFSMETMDVNQHIRHSHSFDQGDNNSNRDENTCDIDKSTVNTDHNTSNNDNHIPINDIINDGSANDDHNPTGDKEEAITLRKRKLTQVYYPEPKRVKLQSRHVQTQVDVCEHCTKPRPSLHELFSQCAIDNDSQRGHQSSHTTEPSNDNISSNHESDSEEAETVQKDSEKESSRATSVESEENEISASTQKNDTQSLNEEESDKDSENAQSISIPTDLESNASDSAKRDTSDNLKSSQSKHSRATTLRDQNTEDIRESDLTSADIGTGFAPTESQTENNNSNQSKTNAENEKDKNQNNSRQISSRQSEHRDANVRLVQDEGENNSKKSIIIELSKRRKLAINTAVSNQDNDKGLHNVTAAIQYPLPIVTNPTKSTPDQQNVRNVVESTENEEQTVATEKRRIANVTTHDFRQNDQTVIISKSDHLLTLEKETVPTTKRPLIRNATVTTQDYQTQKRNEIVVNQISTENDELNAVESANGKSTQIVETEEQTVLNTDFHNTNITLNEVRQIETQTQFTRPSQDHESNPDNVNARSAQDIQSDNQNGSTQRETNAGIRNANTQSTQRTESGQDNANAGNGNGNPANADINPNETREENAHPNIGSSENTTFNLKFVGRRIVIKNCHCPDCPLTKKLFSTN